MKAENRSPVARAATRQAIAAGDVLGVTVSWDFNSFAAPRAPIRETFERHGFAGCFDPKGDRLTAKAAIKLGPNSGEIRKGRGIIVAELEAPNKDTPAAFAVYKKRTKEGEVGDRFRPGARVRMDPKLDLAVSLPLEGQPHGDPDCMKVAEQIADRCNLVRTHVTNGELSDALVTAGKSTRWIPYRYLGGTYFVIEGDGADRFCALLDDLEATGGKEEVDTFHDQGQRSRFEPTITELRADDRGRNEGNVRRYSSAAVESQMADIIRQLEKYEKEGPPARQSTVERRITECEEVIERARFYAPLLREVADKMVDKIEAVKKRLGDLVPDAAAGTDEASVFATLDAKLAPKGRPVRRRRKRSEVGPTVAKVEQPTPELSDDELFSI